MSGATANAAPEFWPGPMEGLFQPEFVAAVHQLELVGRWMTPFLRVGNHVPRRRAIEKFLAPYLAGNVPVVLQLLGGDPETLAGTAALARELPVSGIDLNCGCPSRRVTGHGAGGDLLRDPNRLREIVAALKAAAGNLPLSVKMRAGFADAAEMETLLSTVLAAGADKIFWHCRTVREGYRDLGKERISRFRRAARLCGTTPLILNGDISTVSEAQALIDETGAAGVMIARGWLCDMWLLRRLAGDGDAPSPAEARERFFAELRQHAPPRGTLIECAKMLWGADSEKFRSLLAEL